ncbi:MAG: hypothetical protein HIU84_08900 [Acidobacteria bacterium]|nr:hypothetical protein [Acidobacteriota bacterium]
MNGPSHLRLQRSGLLTLLIASALIEAAWTVYLGWQLPRHYVADDWRLAWVGIDAAQVLMLLCAAWAAWRRRAILIVFTVASGTLLLVDAWFDVMTARGGDFDQSLAFLFLEIPWALVMFWVSYRVMYQFANVHFNGVAVRKIMIPHHTGVIEIFETFETTESAEPDA